MSEASQRRNPRKRDASQMMMFKRALFAINKNNTNSTNSNNHTNHPKTRPFKRARIIINNDLNQNTNNCQNNRVIKLNPSQNKSFNTFSKPPPQAPTNNFLHDQRRQNNPKPNNNHSIRHTPKTRLLSKNNINITTRSHRQNRNNNNQNNYNNNRRYKSYNHNNNNNYNGYDDNYYNEYDNNEYDNNEYDNNEYDNNGYDNNEYDNYEYDDYNNKTRNNNNRNNNNNKNNKKNNNKNNNKNNKKNNNKHGMSYNYVEECRMKKLWTDFPGDKEFILSELEFCKDTSFFITSNSIAHKISMIIKLLLNEYYTNNNIKFTDNTCISILDGLSCIGGNTYSFGKIFNSLYHTIYANELDTERYNALIHNMKTFRKYNIINNNIEFYNNDFNKLHLELGEDISNKIDVIFLDPEWNNGDDYKQTNRGQIHLFDIGKYHLYQVIDNIIMEWYKNVKIIAIKLAKNYDQEFIHRKLQKCKLIENKMYRVGQVAFHNQKLIVIVKSFHNQLDDNEDIDVKKDEQNGLTFDEIFNCLPKMVNKNSLGNSRDAIAVKVLS